MLSSTLSMKCKQVEHVPIYLIFFPLCHMETLPVDNTQMQHCQWTVHTIIWQISYLKSVNIFIMEYMWQIKSYSWSFILSFLLILSWFLWFNIQVLLQERKKKTQQTKIDYPRFGTLEWDEENSAWFLSYFSPGIYTNPNYLGKQKSTSIAYALERKRINRQYLNISHASFLSPSLTFWSPLPSSLEMNSSYRKHGGYLVALLLLIFSSPAKRCCASGKAP